MILQSNLFKTLYLQTIKDGAHLNEMETRKLHNELNGISVEDFGRYDKLLRIIEVKAAAETAKRTRRIAWWVTFFGILFCVGAFIWFITLLASLSAVSHL